MLSRSMSWVTAAYYPASPMAEHFHCLVEIPKGSRNKYEWDEELQAIKLDRFLRDEISHFFSIYKQPEGIAVKVDGWFPRDQALEIIDEAKARFRDGKQSAEEKADDVEAAADESEPDDGAAGDADASGDGDADPTDDAADAKS